MDFLNELKTINKIEVALLLIVIIICGISTKFCYDSTTNYLEDKNLFYGKYSDCFDIQYQKVTIPIELNATYSDCRYSCKKQNASVSYFNNQKNELEKGCYCMKKIKNCDEKIDYYKSPN